MNNNIRKISKTAKQLIVTTEELTENKVLISEITDQVPGVVYQFYANPKGEFGFNYISSRSEDILGLKPDLAGYLDRFSALVLPEYRQSFIDSIGKSVKDVVEWKYEGELQKPSGEKIWFSGNSVPTTHKDKVIFNGIVTDISARKKVEILLKTSKENYDGLFGQMLNGFAYHKIILDKSGKPVDYEFIETNPAFEKMTGLKNENIVGKKATEVLPGIEKDLADWIGKYGEVSLFGKEIKFENYSEPLKKWFSISAYSPRKGYFATMFEDITHRKNAENLLKQEQVVTKTVIDSIPGTFYVIDKNGKYSRWNSFQQDTIVGKPEDQVANTSALDTIHPDDRALVQSKIAKIMLGAPSEVVEGRVLLKGGPEFIWMLMTGQRMLVGGEPFLVGTGIDITEKKKIEVDLKNQYEELKKINEVMVGRELKMVELKGEIEKMQVVIDDLKKNALVSGSKM